MTKKTYCDSCSNETLSLRNVLAAVPLLKGGNVQISSCDPGGHVDLCETCVCKAFASKLSRAELMALWRLLLRGSLLTR